MASASTAPSDATSGSSISKDRSYKSALSVSVSAIGQEMLQQLEADCEQAARGARQRAEEFAKFIDEQIGPFNNER